MSVTTERGQQLQFTDEIVPSRSSLTTSRGQTLHIEERQPSFLNRVTGIFRAIQRPSRQIGQAVEATVTPRAPTPLTSTLFGPAARAFPSTRAVGEIERQAIGRTAGEVARIVTNPVDVAIAALTPQLIPARTARFAVGAGLGAASALGEERSTPQQVGLRAAGLGILSALPVARRFRSTIRPAETGTLPTPLELSPGPASQGTQADRVQKAITALEEAAPIRGEQEALFTAERGRRIAKVLSIRKELGGEAGFKAELGALKGELPKAQFESIRQRFSQADIDGLFDDINSSTALDPWEQLTAKGGLAKLLNPAGGQVPTQGELQELGRVFGPQFVKALRNKRPLLQKVGEFAVEAFNLPRALMASFDLSAPLRQGLFLIGRPRQWLPAFGSMFRQFASERSFQSAQESIQSRPTFQLMQQARLALTDIGEKVTQREEAFMSRLGERIPAIGTVVRASNRGYVGFLNKLRADTFDDFVKKGQQLGIAEDPGYLRSVARYVNAATGRGDLGKLQTSAVLLNTVFFSPRLLASRFQLLRPDFYARLHPAVRQRALADALTMTSAGLSVLGLVKLNGVEVGTDPRSADFGKIKVGNTRFDIWGGFQQPIVVLSRLLSMETVSSTTGRVTPLTGEFGKPSRADIIFRFLQSKQSPILSLITTMMRGQTIGRGPARLSNEIVDRFIPLFISDLFEVIQEHGVARGWMAIPGAFGVGILSYGDLIPVLKETPSGRITVSFRDQPTLGETVVNRLTGRRVSNLPKSFKEPLAAVKRIQQQRDIKLDEAREIVRKTGRPVQVGNSIVFRNEHGIIQTRTQGQVLTPERTLEALLEQTRR